MFTTYDEKAMLDRSLLSIHRKILEHVLKKRPTGKTTQSFLQIKNALVMLTYSPRLWYKHI